MVKKGYHQRIAFEYFLNEKQLQYLAINESNKPTIFEKNLDFMVITKSKIYIVDVKGKQIPYQGGSGFLWETWIHQNDLIGLRQWEDFFKSLFQKEVESLIAYVYWIKEDKFLKDFKMIYEFNGKKYGIKAITISEFEKNKIKRRGFSTEREVWQLPRKIANNTIKDIDSFFL